MRETVSVFLLDREARKEIGKRRERDELKREMSEREGGKREKENERQRQGECVPSRGDMQERKIER